MAETILPKRTENQWRIAVIGGSGLYQIAGLENRRELKIDSPFGAPSAAIIAGELAGQQFLFLPRHGDGINMRANIDALKRAGCSDILPISAVGSLQEQYAPGDFVMVDQFIDRTRARPSSFFGNGLVAHISMADPVCARLSEYAGNAARNSGVNLHKGGCYLAMEGPQFSSRAESHLYRQWGCDLIGMTAMPEAKLAREAELPYALMAMVTDYDCWREEEAAVNVASVLELMQSNAEKARHALIKLAQTLPKHREAVWIDRALDHAIITAPDRRDAALCAKLDAVAGRVL